MKTGAKDLFQKEQNAMFKNMLKILGSKDGEPVYTFIYYDLENNKQLIDQILDLELDIKKCYYASSYNSTLIAKVKWFSIIRFIFKKNGYILYNKKHDVQTNGKKIRTVRYAMVKTNQ